MTVVHSLAVIFAQSIEARCLVKNEDVVVAGVPSHLRENLWNDEETYISIINLLARLGKYAYPGWYDPAGYFMYVACTIYRLIGVHFYNFHNITRQS